MNQVQLPVDNFKGLIQSALKSKQNLVIVAQPGAGKTTRIPVMVAEAIKKPVWVLEPRRMAALAAAQHIAEEQNWKIPEDIGYQVRYANQARASTRVLFLTEAILAKRLLSEPDLKNVGCIILDEFHERSIHVDLALGLIREMQLMGSTIQVIVMSATLNAKPIADFLGTDAIIEIPGRLFPLEIKHQETSIRLRFDHELIKNLEGLVKKALTETQGDILVFLPGQGEIERTYRHLEGRLSSQVLLLKLHGQMGLEEQRQVLSPSSVRRVILSTNIAESSVTVNGVAAVIDTGLQKIMRQDLRTGFSQLELGKISISSADQRAGRAARQRAGKVYRMWNMFDQNTFIAHEIPDIQRVDLTEAILYLAAQGVSNPLTFSWYEGPPPSRIQKAQNELQAIEALREDGTITELGRKLLSWPLSPRLAKLIEVGRSYNCSQLGIVIAVILSERDFLSPSDLEAHQADQWDCDIRLRIDVFKERCPRQIKLAIDQLASMARVELSWNSVIKELDLMPQLLLSTFSDRLCRRRANQEKALMIGGRGVQLNNLSMAKNSEFFVALTAMDIVGQADSRVQLASGIEKGLLKKALAQKLTSKSQVEFDEKRNQFVEYQQTTFYDLVIEESQPRPAAPDVISGSLAKIAAQRFTTLCKETPALDHWWNRFCFFQSQLGLPQWTEAELEKLLEPAVYGKTSLRELTETDLIYFLSQGLSQDQAQLFNEKVPSHIVMPTGSRIPVHYPAGQAPYLEVRLQEVFGLMSTPLILGDTPIVFHLLAPNYRPVQTTSDLASFWRSTYFEVRKELKTRYPKHSWPEDPLTAKPEAKGRRRQ